MKGQRVIFYVLGMKGQRVLFKAERVALAMKASWQQLRAQSVTGINPTPTVPNSIQRDQAKARGSCASGGMTCCLAEPRHEAAAAA